MPERQIAEGMIVRRSHFVAAVRELEVAVEMLEHVAYITPAAREATVTELRGCCRSLRALMTENTGKVAQ